MRSENENEEEIGKVNEIERNGRFVKCEHEVSLRIKGCTVERFQK